MILNEKTDRREKFALLDITLNSKFGKKVDVGSRRFVEGMGCGHRY